MTKTEKADGNSLTTPEGFVIPTGENPIEYGARVLKQELKDHLIIGGWTNALNQSPYMIDTTHYIPFLMSEVEGSEPIGDFSAMHSMIALFPDGQIKTNFARFKQQGKGLGYSDLETIDSNFKPASDTEIVKYAPPLTYNLIRFAAVKLMEYRLFMAPPEFTERLIALLRIPSRRPFLGRLKTISDTALRVAGKYVPKPRGMVPALDFFCNEAADLFYPDDPEIQHAQQRIITAFRKDQKSGIFLEPGEYHAELNTHIDRVNAQRLDYPGVTYDY